MLCLGLLRDADDLQRGAKPMARYSQAMVGRGLQQVGRVVGQQALGYRVLLSGSQSREAFNEWDSA